MPALQPTGYQMRAFRDDPHSGPIVQVNLLKYRPRAVYPEGSNEAAKGRSGREAYQLYADGIADIAVEAGGSCLLAGETERYFIGAGDWDAVLVMAFPDRQAFLSMINHAGYDALHRHREAGLLCQDLITTRPRVQEARDA